MVDVLHENELAVELFQHLKIRFEVTMGGAVYTGFAPGDVKEKMDIFEVPKNQRIDTLQRLTVLEEKATAMLNKRSNKGGSR